MTVRKERDKIQIVRHHILDKLESGEYSPTTKLPGARKIAEDLGISFLTTQQAIETLAQDGILEVKPRKGTFVQTGWYNRILDDNICIFNLSSTIAWFPELLKIVQGQMPGLRPTTVFNKSTLEYRATASAQSNAADYLDLSEFFNECFSDRGDFFSEPFDKFYFEGKLTGIPFIFSPRVLFYNPSVFIKCGCPLPQEGWEWNDFITCLKQLRTKLPCNKIINWHDRPFYWMNFITRAGGRLFRQNATEPVQIDSPQTIKGIKLYIELKETLGLDKNTTVPDFHKDFFNEESAMLLGERQMVYTLNKHHSQNWRTIALPVIPEGADLTTQATDVLCVRKSCTTPELVRTFIKTMLSEQVQNFVADINYGIPIRKSSAFRTLKLNNPTDALFIQEMEKVKAEYNMESLTLSNLVLTGIERIMVEKLDPEKELRNIAQMARTYLKITEFTKEKYPQNFSQF